MSSKSTDLKDNDRESLSSTDDPLKGVAEISPNKRYIRFEELLSQENSHRIQQSFKAFDTKNGIEVAWHIINLNSLKDSEQSQVIQCVQTVNNIQSKYITEFLGYWVDKTSRTLNIITTAYAKLGEFITGKVITLRWRIVKKWCKQI